MASPDSRRAWQLPAGIDELLPDAAAHLEALRRTLLDCAARWGYRLVVPPMLEYTDSLLVGVGEDLDLLTYKMPDQLSGRMLGLRADMTPQVARIDAHSLGGEGVNRLCYAGSTLHTRARSLAASRSPMQLGAELYGDAGSAADLEVIDLMVSMLEASGIDLAGLTLDLGHGNLFGPLLDATGVTEPVRRAQIFDAVQRKSKPDLAPLLTGLAPESAALLAAFVDMQGGTGVLQRAAEMFVAIPAAAAAVDEVAALVEGVRQRRPQLAIHVDLAELRGYHYHTGVVFACYAQGLGEALAHGGRYDNVGAVYGRARPATGFATDLRLLAAQVPPAARSTTAILAPGSDDPALQRRVRELRAAGETVVVALGATDDPRCGRILKQLDGQWQVLPRTEKEPS